MARSSTGPLPGEAGRVVIVTAHAEAFTRQASVLKDLANADNRDVRNGSGTVTMAGLVPLAIVGASP